MYYFCAAKSRLVNRSYLKYTFILLLMISFINRGLFVSAVWVDSGMRTAGNAEINSLFELIVVLVENRQNEIDEDENSQEHYASVASFQPMINRAVNEVETLTGTYSSVEKISFSTDESLPGRLIYETIEQPPEA